MKKKPLRRPVRKSRRRLYLFMGVITLLLLLAVTYGRQWYGDYRQTTPWQTVTLFDPMPSEELPNGLIVTPEYLQ